MLKDKIDENFKEISKDKENDMKEDMGMKFRGELEIWAYKNGELIHHDTGDNIVTKWAKHATMHMLTSESYSTHGDRTLNTITAFSKRSIGVGDHIADNNNNDGSMISDAQYLGDNADYYDSLGASGTPQYKYWTSPNVDLVPSSISPVFDNTSFAVDDKAFQYPFFPTKMLFGTGIEYATWADVITDGRDGSGQDGYGHVSNGSWSQVSFDDSVDTNTNYYSAIWNGTTYELTPTRTVNDIYSAALTSAENPMNDDNFAVKGAIKDATFNGTNGGTVLADVDGKSFATGIYRGIGRPSFIYAKRNARYMEGGEAELEFGETVGTEDLESKITYTVVMPEQSSAGEFYPYNGYTLKVAGLFADAALLLKNSVPADEADNDDVTTQLEYTNYQQQPSGILWATRNIAPIFKSHDTKIIAQWTIYL